MSLYWEAENVAVEIVDDPSSQPFDREAHPGATVLQITCDEILDPEAFSRFATALAGHLGSAMPQDEPGSPSKHAALREQLFGGSTW